MNYNNPSVASPRQLTKTYTHIAKSILLFIGQMGQLVQLYYSVTGALNVWPSRLGTRNYHYCILFVLTV